ncbi:MAG: hypothetical protein ACO1NQ_12430 [Flavobacteriales bacterium]
MNKLILALVLANCSTFALCQTDTVKTRNTQRLELGVNSQEGGFAHITSDADTTDKPSPLVINTKRKRITITTEDKDWISETDSVSDVISELRKERRNLFTYWSGIDIGANALLGPDGSGDFPREFDFLQLDQARSRFVSINFMEQKIEFGSHHVGLLTGLGWEFTNYRFRDNSVIRFEGDTITAFPVETPQFIKSKLRQSGFRVPLMLEFNTKRAKMPTEAEVLAAARDTVGGKKPRSFSFSNKNNFHIAVGVIGTWYYDSMYKQKYRQDGRIEKDIDKGDHRLLPYRLAASARIGYGSFNLFAEYALTPLFQQNVRPELTPLNVGLTIIGFN